MDKLHARVNKLCAIFIFSFSLTAFLLTAAPTVAFWECGENAAIGHSLGIGHPPANPLFTMMLRVSTLFLFFVDDTGFRMNIMAAVVSALAAVFIYLIAIRIIIALFGVPDSFRRRITVYVGGLTAGFSSVFGKTFWFSAGEASKINFFMFVIAVCCWITLVWAQSKSALRDRLILLAVFICFAGIGMQIYSLIVLAPMLLFVILTDGSKLKNWRFGTLLISFALIGLSTNFYLPVRSSTQPLVNVGQPSTYEALKNYLGEKPYGEENMFVRMLWPRGSFSNQFGIEGHIGYGGHHITQFFRFSEQDFKRSLFSNGITGGFVKLFIYLIPTALMLYAWRYVYKKENVYALLLISIFLLTSVFLVYYMNFADGTRPEKIDYEYWVHTGRVIEMPLAQREVRIRDYAFSAAYMHLGMWIGIGASIILNALFTNRRKFFRQGMAPAAAVLFAFSPALPLTQNWQINNRSNDFLAYDHSYNLLMSCEKDAILFTSGDNETFPLWALQEAYGIRKDVRVVNLTLLNKEWYIKQLKTLSPKVPVSYTENEIDTRLRAVVNPYENAARMEIAGVDVVIPPKKEQPFFKIQDQMVIDILRTTNWSKPIYFASAVPDMHKAGLEPYTRLEGLACRIMPYEVSISEKVDIDKTVYLIDSVFKFRSAATGRDHFDETSQKMVYNYANTFIQLALALNEKVNNQKQLLSGIEDKEEAALLKAQIADNINTAHLKLSQCVKFMPSDWRLRYIRHEVLMENEQFEEAEKYAREAIRFNPQEHRYKQMLAAALGSQGRYAEANDALRMLQTSGIDLQLVYLAIAKNFEAAGMYDSAIHVVRQYSLINPADPQTQNLIEYYLNMEQK
ncbi:MAG: DUF2723 domain-containing protein [Chitinispirillales bacterium]|jgi:hypothetical protein|nr:DUF2723 domain-containing protein [Chitinispirillales bacterium]